MHCFHASRASTGSTQLLMCWLRHQCCMVCFVSTTGPPRGPRSCWTRSFTGRCNLYSIFIFLDTDRCSILFCRPTQATTELLDKIIYRVETENGWDQALFNECIFFPSRPGYKARRAVCSACSEACTCMPMLPACLHVLH